ncbi:MAG: hypothetical protein IJE82_00515, partial [Alphaproteobacteria bacterium]|nr:hypothetical protein [Alphaproteobacteria bacterium]
PRIYANCAGLVLIYSDSPRPGINKNTAVDAVFLFILVERADSNGKLEFTKVRTFHSIYHRNVINLRVSSYLCELRGACSYILGFAPTRDKQKYRS